MQKGRGAVRGFFLGLIAISSAQRRLASLPDTLRARILSAASPVLIRRVRKKTAPARGANWGRHSSDAMGALHPVVHHQMTLATLVPADCSNFPWGVSELGQHAAPDQLGRPFYLFGLDYLSEDCSLHQGDHRPKLFGRPVAERRGRAPACKGGESLERNHLRRSHSPNLRKTLGDEDGRSRTAPFSK
jgi:hypothetical protein